MENCHTWIIISMWQNDLHTNTSRSVWPILYGLMIKMLQYKMYPAGELAVLRQLLFGIVFFRENKTWHCMGILAGQMITWSAKAYFPWKIEKKIRMSSATILLSALSINTQFIFCLAFLQPVEKKQKDLRRSSVINTEHLRAFIARQRWKVSNILFLFYSFEHT